MKLRKMIAVILTGVFLLCNSNMIAYAHECKTAEQEPAKKLLLTQISFWEMKKKTTVIPL